MDSGCGAAAAASSSSHCQAGAHREGKARKHLDQRGQKSERKGCGYNKGVSHVNMSVIKWWVWAAQCAEGVRLSFSKQRQGVGDHPLLTTARAPRASKCNLDKRCTPPSVTT
jgi:hypothetical protein